MTLFKAPLELAIALDYVQHLLLEAQRLQSAKPAMSHLQYPFTELQWDSGNVATTEDKYVKSGPHREPHTYWLEEEGRLGCF